MSGEFDSQSDDSGSHLWYRFVAPGSQLIYKIAALGKIQCLWGFQIVFEPDISIVDSNDGKSISTSLHLSHRDPHGNPVSECKLDRDEVQAWTHFILDLEVSGPQTFLEVQSFELSSRHGIRWFLPENSNSLGGYSSLFLNSQQAAMLPPDCRMELLKIFTDFESMCEKYEP